MKINRTSKNIPLLVFIAAVIITLGAYTAYAITHNVLNQKALTKQSDTSSKKAESDKEQSNNLKENPSGKNDSPNTDQPAAPTEETETHKQKVQMVISVDTSDGIRIRGGANYPISEESICYALLTGPANQSIRKDTVVLQNPASTDCKTINIPAGELSSGSWSASLYYSSAHYEGVSDAATFTIN